MYKIHLSFLLIFAFLAVSLGNIMAQDEVFNVSGTNDVSGKIKPLFNESFNGYKTKNDFPKEIKVSGNNFAIDTKRGGDKWLKLSVGNSIQFTHKAVSGQIIVQFQFAAGNTWMSAPIKILNSNGDVIAEYNVEGYQEERGFHMKKVTRNFETENVEMINVNKAGGVAEYGFDDVPKTIFTALIDTESGTQNVYLNGQKCIENALLLKETVDVASTVIQFDGVWNDTYNLFIDNLKIGYVGEDAATFVAEPEKVIEKPQDLGFFVYDTFANGKVPDSWTTAVESYKMSVEDFRLGDNRLKMDIQNNKPVFIRDIQSEVNNTRKFTVETTLNFEKKAFELNINLVDKNNRLISQCVLGNGQEQSVAVLAVNNDSKTFQKNTLYSEELIDRNFDYEIAIQTDLDNNTQNIYINSKKRGDSIPLISNGDVSMVEFECTQIEGSTGAIYIDNFCVVPEYSAERSKLRSTINTGRKLLTGTMVGTKPGQISKESGEKLTAAIHQAQGLLLSEPANKNKLNESLTLLTSEKSDFEANIIANNIMVDCSKTYQTIDNFGASLAWWGDPIGEKWSEENKNKIADLLFSQDSGIGLSSVRFNIGAGSAETDSDLDSNRAAECFQLTEGGAFDFTKQAGQQWFLRAAKERGTENLIAFANSPPVWATLNGKAYKDKGANISTNLKPAYEGKFADFLTEVLVHFKNEGLEFKYISPVNEPIYGWDGGQEGCQYSTSDIKRVIDALYSSIRQKGLDTKISTPEAGAFENLLDTSEYKFAKEFLGDVNMRSKIDNIAAHSYWADEDLDKRRSDTLAVVRKYGGEQAKLWQSEYCIMEHNRDLGMDSAIRVGRLMFHDLAVANVSAWQWWLGVGTSNYKDGLIYTYYTATGKENILESKILWTMGNYSKFIRPDFIRIELTGAHENDGLMGSAYLSPENDKIVIVYVNAGQSMRKASISFSGIPGNRTVSKCTLHITSNQYNLAEQGNQNINNITVPGKSVVTVVCELN